MSRKYDYTDHDEIVDSMYESVLSPDKYDLFMEKWASHIETTLHGTDLHGSSPNFSSKIYSNPVLERHFRRALEMIEQIGGRSRSLPEPFIAPGSLPLLEYTSTEGITFQSEEAVHVFVFPLNIESIKDALQVASAKHFDKMLDQLHRAPTAGTFKILTLESPNPLIPGDLLIARTKRNDSNAVVLELRPLTMKWEQSVAEFLTETFSLTPSEVVLVQDLVEVGDLATIATRTNRSRETLRVHLRSIFQKTRTRSQPELLRLVAAFILFLSKLPTEPHSKQPANINSFEEIEIGCANRVIFQCAGPETGQPIIFLHGMLDSLAALPYFADQLTRHNIRLIAPIRNNFGPARPDDRVREAPDIHAYQISEIIRRLQLDQVVLIGHMAGALYAFATAARLGDKVAGVINIAGGVPIRSIKQFSRMTPRQRTVAYTARFAPALLPAILRAGIAQIDSKDADLFIRALYLPGSPDRGLLENQDIMRTILDGYRFSVSQGEQAFRIDSWHVTRDWSKIVLGSRCPVLLIHGHHDPVVTFESVTDFAESSNRIEVNAVEGGQLILYQSPERVFACIKKFLEARIPYLN